MKRHTKVGIYATLVEEICREKREAGIFPPLATELDLKNELSRRGVKLTAEAFVRIRAELEARPDIITRRCLKFNAYEIRYADITNTET